MGGYSQSVYYENEEEIKVNGVILVDNFVVNFNFIDVIDDKIQKKYGGVLFQIILYVLLFVKFFVFFKYFKCCGVCQCYSRS